MGMFNTLHAPVQCQACNSTYSGQFQFKFGLAWLLDYRLGDKLEWDDSRASKGKPGLPRVKLYSSLYNSTCSSCGATRGKYEEEFDIYVEHDVLLSVTPMETYDIYLNAPEEAQGSYAVL